MINTLDVYKEVFSKLKSLPYNVYDEVPENAANPHIRVDYSTNMDNSGKNYNSTIYYQYIHAFSSYKGRKEILEMADSIVDVLSDDIYTESFVMYPKIERCDITQESDRVSGPVHGYHTEETYRHAIIVIKYTIYEN